jgi:hypothetical protein
MAPMSAAASSPPQQPAATTASTNLGPVLGLVRCLIDFGRRWADRFREDSLPKHEFRFHAGLFGTSDVAQILLRIARGLRRAVALEAVLLARAQRGRDLKVAPVRISLPRNPSEAPCPRATRAPLPLEPSDEEIAADVRRRPVGAVVVDICLDLGIVGGELGHDMYDELRKTVMLYGGNLIRLLRMDDAARRAREYIAILRSDAPLPPELQPFPIPFEQLVAQALATGPPT